MYFSTNGYSDWMKSGHGAAAFSWAQRASQCCERLVELNQQMVKAILAEAEKTWQLAVAGEAPVELWNLQANAARSLAEKSLSYNHQILRLATQTQADSMKLTKARFEDYNSKLQAFVNGLTIHAPAGSEAAVTVLKSSFAGAGIAYDTVLKATAQAIAMAQRNQPASTAPA